MPLAIGLDLVEAVLSALIHYLTNLYLLYLILRFAMAMAGSVSRVSVLRPARHHAAPPSQAQGAPPALLPSGTAAAPAGP